MMVQLAYEGLKDVVEALRGKGLALYPASTPLSEVPTNGARITYTWAWEPRGGAGLHLKGAHVFELAITSAAPDREAAVESVYQALAQAVARLWGRRAKLAVLGLEGDENVLTLRAQLELVALEQGGVL